MLGSPFGHRSDPIAGLRAMHEGIDFSMPKRERRSSSQRWCGAVAPVITEFGNLIDVDHGDGLISRYAHLSRMNVKAGQMLKRGESIGAVGSTGRSTGSHLHFEVRMLGVAQNPALFLQEG
jgi:murein DD-endopeptidase MepM/ murein hydrolase activator NlpD